MPADPPRGSPPPAPGWASCRGPLTAACDVRPPGRLLQNPCHLGRLAAHLHRTSKGLSCRGAGSHRPDVAWAPPGRRRTHVDLTSRQQAVASSHGPASLARHSAERPVTGGQLARHRGKVFGQVGRRRSRSERRSDLVTSATPSSAVVCRYERCPHRMTARRRSACGQVPSGPGDPLDRPGAGTGSFEGRDRRCRSPRSPSPSQIASGPGARRTASLIRGCLLQDPTPCPLCSLASSWPRYVTGDRGTCTLGAGYSHWRRCSSK
jgi:hypothetical protein